jgi:D-arabinose 1-dehydrogenase-like Zn-dependent alcohol dehydrogenase
MAVPALFTSTSSRPKVPNVFSTAALTATIVETYPFADAAKAYERVAEGRARFRAVLTM